MPHLIVLSHNSRPLAFLSNTAILFQNISSGWLISDVDMQHEDRQHQLRVFRHRWACSGKSWTSWWKGSGLGRKDSYDKRRSRSVIKSSVLCYLSVRQVCNTNVVIQLFNTYSQTSSYSTHRLDKQWLMNNLLLHLLRNLSMVNVGI